jgi:SNF2 family DNA or RNA helicase
MLKLHQVCNGFLKSNEGVIVEMEDCPKLKELIKVIEEGDGKFIIWANYIHNIESICNLLKKLYGDKSVVSIYGAVSVEDRTIAVNKFQNDSDVKFFVGNPTTGGYGLTLTAASYVVYFSNSYNLEVRQQSEDRAHRIGQKKNVTYVDILMRNSIDMLIVSALQRKIKISAETLGEEVKRWLTN